MLKNLVKKFRSQTINDGSDGAKCSDDGIEETAICIVEDVEFGLCYKDLYFEVAPDASEKGNGVEGDSEEDEVPPNPEPSWEKDKGALDETKSLAVSQTSDYCASDQSLFACSIAPSDLDSNSRDSLGYESGLHGSSGDGSVFVHSDSHPPTSGVGFTGFEPGLEPIPQSTVPSAFRPVGSSSSRRRYLFRSRGSFDAAGRFSAVHSSILNSSPHGVATRHCSVDGNLPPSPSHLEGSDPSADHDSEKRKRSSGEGLDPESPAPPDKFGLFNSSLAPYKAGSVEVLPPGFISPVPSQGNASSRASPASWVFLPNIDQGPAEEDDLEVQQVLGSPGDSGPGTPKIVRPSPVLANLSVSAGTLPRVSPRKRGPESSDNDQGSLLSLSERRLSDAMRSDAEGSCSSTSEDWLTERAGARLNFEKMREKMGKSRRTRGLCSARAKLRGLSGKGSS